MTRKSIWEEILEAAREEALTAAELYNRPRGARSTEGFLVHMHLAWLYLLQAELRRQGVDYRYRVPGSRRYVRVDGQPKTWELETCIGQRWPDTDDPVRRNLELTVRLRNRIEHRPHPGIGVIAAGFFHSLVLNFDEEMVAVFGARWSIADLVHVPISLSSFSREGMARLAAALADLPQPIRDFFVQIRADTPKDVATDRRFELRIDLVQKRAPRDEADLAITFIREEDLSEAERSAYRELAKTGRVIIREKQRLISNLGQLKPKGASQRIEALIPFHFAHATHFPRACQHFKVRPPSGSDNPMATVDKYCTYDEPHGDYTYTPAFVTLVVERCSTADGFRAVTGLDPRPKE